MSTITIKDNEPKIPADMSLAINASAATKAQWDSLTAIGRRDFVYWVQSAKQPQTRTRRIESLGSRLASGKRRPCCFAVIPMGLYKALPAHPQAQALWKDLSADEKRDFAEWIEAAQPPETSQSRIEASIAALLTGARRP